MRLTNATKSCPYSPHSGPVGCLPAPNIFPLAKETFPKGKMFWNLYCKICNNEGKGCFISFNLDELMKFKRLKD